MQARNLLKKGFIGTAFIAPCALAIVASAQMGGAGGMGGGGLGGGGMGGMGPSPEALAKQAAARAKIIWQRPDAAQEPSWLTSRKASIEATEKTRNVLGRKIGNFDLKGVPLTEVMLFLSEETGTHFYMNTPELDLLGVDPETPITVSGPESSVRGILQRILDSLELTYKVHENSIEITSKDGADADPAIRFYDLSYVLPNASNADQVMTALQQSIDPDSWLAAGGTSTCVLVGSMMVVSAPDSTHEKIEILLMNLSKMNPQNLQQASPALPPSGFGGGGGGMF